MGAGGPAASSPATGAGAIEARRQAVIVWGLVALFAALDAVEAVKLLAFQPLGADFLPLWTAGHLAVRAPASVYDAWLVTRAQAWLLPGLTWPRPFVYPPTALIALAPLGLAPFWTALATSLAIGVAGFAFALTRLTRRLGAIALAIVSPPVALAALVGQTSLLVAAAAALAVAWLPERPRAAGALLAAAAALKPQALVMAPVALVALGAGEALVSAIVVMASLIGLSLVWFGLAPWERWIASLPAFQAEIAAAPGMASGVIAPTGLAQDLGLGGVGLAIWRTLFALLGVALCWIAFRRSPGAPQRLGAMMAGGILASPYALHYDGALLVPAAVAGLTAASTAGDWLVALFALLSVSAVTAPHLGSAAVIIFAALTLYAVLQSPPRASRA